MTKFPIDILEAFNARQQESAHKPHLFSGYQSVPKFHIIN
jgi:hypothetical protein